MKERLATLKGHQGQEGGRGGGGAGRTWIATAVGLTDRRERDFAQKSVRAEGKAVSMSTSLL